MCVQVSNNMHLHMLWLNKSAEIKICALLWNRKTLSFHIIYQAPSSIKLVTGFKCLTIFTKGNITYIKWKCDFFVCLFWPILGKEVIHVSCSCLQQCCNLQKRWDKSQNISMPWLGRDSLPEIRTEVFVLITRTRALSQQGWFISRTVVPGGS